MPAGDGRSNQRPRARLDHILSRKTTFSRARPLCGLPGSVSLWRTTTSAMFRWTGGGPLKTRRTWQQGGAGRWAGTPPVIDFSYIEYSEDDEDDDQKESRDAVKPDYRVLQPEATCVCTARWGLRACSFWVLCGNCMVRHSLESQVFLLCNLHVDPFAGWIDESLSGRVGQVIGSLILGLWRFLWSAPVSTARLRSPHMSAPSFVFLFIASIFACNVDGMRLKHLTSTFFLPAIDGGLPP